MKVARGGGAAAHPGAAGRVNNRLTTAAAPT